MKTRRNLLTAGFALAVSLLLSAPVFASDYTVVKGDCLWRIARNELGEGIRWVEIYDANRQDIRDPDLIYPGQVFKIPDGKDGESVYSAAPLVGEATDYSDAVNWASLPAADKPADTFYLYPTAYLGEGANASPIASIEDETMRAAALVNIERTCGVFSASTNVYAPFYRQSSLDALAGLSGDALLEFQMQEQRTDVYAALDYYFENLNDGRPYFLAGHSQGSIMLKLVLREYMQLHPEYYERMIASYVLGYSITNEDMEVNPDLKFAEGEDDVGVIVSWNTEGPKNGENLCVLPDSLAINPLNWRRDDTYAPAGENLGSRIVNTYDNSVDEYLPGLADAQLDVSRGVLLCYNDNLPYISVYNSDLADIFGDRSFHNSDYLFYYYNIMENVRVRTAAWFLRNNGHEIAELAGTATDYADPDNWIAQPTPELAVDTFYLYPTAYLPDAEDAPVICGVDDAGMRAAAANNFASNEGAFSLATNVFAPYYRQTSVTALQDYGADGAAEILSREPRTDVYAALDYYFEHLNGGRPFILAGHSQGSMLLRIVLKDYMPAHPEYFQNMIAAYAVGYSITQDDLDESPWLRFAERSSDTGVVVSWNTEGPGNGESRLVLPGAISINPINWKRDDTYASAGENLGSMVRAADGTVSLVSPGVADAQVDTERGVVVCTNTDFPYLDIMSLLGLREQVFGEKSFHGNDYSFYYANIQQNVADRVEAWFAKN